MKIAFRLQTRSVSLLPSLVHNTRRRHLAIRYTDVINLPLTISSAASFANHGNLLFVLRFIWFRHPPRKEGSVGFLRCFLTFTCRSVREEMLMKENVRWRIPWGDTEIGFRLWWNYNPGCSKRLEKQGVTLDNTLSGWNCSVQARWGLDWVYTGTKRLSLLDNALRNALAKLCRNFP